VKNKKILVTGATGATGGSAIAALRASGREVRALVHEDDARAAALRNSGVEVVTGDLLDIDSVRAALEDVSAAYFVYPLSPNILEGTVKFAQAAKEAGVNAIVNTSQMTSRRDSKSHAAQNHWLAEQVFDWCAVAVTHLRPTLFAEWLLYPVSWRDYSHKNELALPFGDGRFAPIAAQDQGRVIAAILANPAAHAGCTYQLFGPVELDGHGIASAASEALSRTVRYLPIEISEFASLLQKNPRFSSPFLIQHLSAIALDCRNGITAGTNSNVEKLTGVAPLSVQQFVKANQAAFVEPA
jgi:uncharacterized protein YbjT (DUF2867 family)